MHWTIGNNKDDEIKVIVITGACRSGKTTLSRLLGSMENIEWIEEPWSLLQLPLLEHFSMIDEQIAINFIKSNVKELFNDNILLRNGNFRPGDLSSIWNIKKTSNIFNRLNNIKTRDDVRNYVNKNNNILLIDIPEVQPFIEILYKCFSNIKIIHVVRNGLSVANEIKSKGWFSKANILNPQNNLLYYKYNKEIIDKEYFIPWWVEKDNINSFLNYNEFSKGLYYWFRMLSYNDFYKKEKKFSNYKIIKHEDMLINPIDILNELVDFLDAKKTTITDKLVNEIYNDKRNQKINYIIDDIEQDTLLNIKDVMQNYGYKL